MAVGDDSNVNLEVTASTDQAEARLASVEAKMEAVKATASEAGGEFPVEVDQAEANLAAVAAKAEEVRAEILTPSFVEIDAGPAIEALRSVAEAEAVLAEAGGAVKLAEPLEAVVPAAQPAEEAILSLAEEIAKLREAAVASGAAGVKSFEGLALAAGEAEASVAHFEARARSSPRGAALAYAEATVQVKLLREAIAEVGAAGGDTAPLEAAVRRLEARMEEATARAGRMRAAFVDARQEMNAAARAAGEFEGQMGGLRGMLTNISPGLGKVAGNLEAMYFGMAVVQQILGEVAHGLSEMAVGLGLSDEKGKEFEEGLKAHFSLNPITHFMFGFHQAKKDQVEGYEELTTKATEWGISVEKAASALGAFAQGGPLLGIANLNALLSDGERLANEEAANLRKMLEASGVKDTAKMKLEELRKKFEELRQEERLAGQESRAFAESIDSTSQAVDKSRIALDKGIALLLKSGPLTAASAQIVIDKLNAQIEAMRRLGESTSSLEQVRDAFEKMGRALKIDEAIADLQRFSATVSTSGHVTKEQADKITAEGKRIVEAIRELPTAEQEAMQKRLAFLEKLLAGYEKFTTEHAKLLAKQAAEAKKEADAELAEMKRREDATRTFLDTIRGLLSKPLSPMKASVDTKDVAAARAELADLEKKSSGGYVSGDDLNRMEELKAKLADVGEIFGNVGRQARASGKEEQSFGAEGEAAAAKAREALVTLLGKSSEFGDALKAMTPEMRDSLRQLAEGFISDLGGGLVKGQADVSAFVDRFVGLLQSSGAVSSKFGAEMAAAFGQGTDSLDRLFGAASGLQSGLDAAGQSTIVTIHGVEQLVTAADAATASTTAAADATAKSTEASQEATTGYIRAAEAAKGLSKDGLVPLKQDYVDIVNHVKDAADATVKLVTVNKDAAEGVKDLASGLQPLPEQVNAVADSLTSVDTGLRLFHDNLTAVGPLIGVFQQPAQDAAKLADAAPQAAAGVGAVGKAAGDSAPLLKSMSDQMATGTDQGGKLRGVVSGLHGDLSSLNTILGQTVKLLVELTKARAGAAAGG